MECAASLDILASLAEGLTTEVNEGKGLLSRIVAMLTRMTMPKKRLAQETGTRPTIHSMGRDGRSSDRGEVSNSIHDYNFEYDHDYDCDYDYEHES